jgi:PAS domain-containing protein
VAAEPASSDVLEIYISGSGTYLGANDEALRVLGYTAAELRSLSFGTLSGSSPEAAARVWRAFIDEGLPIPPTADVRLYTHRGQAIAVRFVGTERIEPGRWVSRYRLLTGQVLATNQPFVLQTLLGQWRDLERRVAAAVADADQRASLEGQLAEIKALYLSEQRRRASPTDGLP